MSSQKDAPFLFSLKFQNTLPNAPSGPFFKKVPLYSVMNPSKEYKISTLEKSFIWQPNFGLDMGINLDLVDQESILVQEIPGNNNSKIEVESYLTENLDKGRGKNIPITQDEKPFWLRSTTYMSNDVFRPVLKSRDDDSNLKTKQLLSEQDLENPLSIVFIEDTFKSVNETVRNLKKQEIKRKLAFSVPLLPMQMVSDGGVSKAYSIVQFDEDPAAVAAVRSDSAEPSRKRSKVIESSIITNVRVGKNPNRGALSIFESSLVSSSRLDEDAPSVTNADEGRPLLFEWVKDYEMKVQSHQMEDSFLFYLDESIAAERPHDEDAVVAYVPYSARIEMKKVGMDDSTPLECIVTRRKKKDVDLT